MRRLFGSGSLLLTITLFAPGPAAAQVKTSGGIVQGTTTADGQIRVFKGIPFAAPPVGDRRWQAPRPAAPWQGVKDATAFGPRCLQGQIFADIVFKELSEILKAALTTQPWFAPTLDGYFLTEEVAATFAAGRQARHSAYSSEIEVLIFIRQLSVCVVLR